jgi:H+/Cl- antiporter ClcA
MASADDLEPTGDARTSRFARAYDHVRQLIGFDLAEQATLVLALVRWTVLGSVVGVLAGLSSAFFLVTLDWATEARLEHPWVLFLLPVAGFAVGAAYHHGAGRAAAGNNLIIDEIHDPNDWIPRRMAPLVYGGTIITQLFGGSAGREGTAIQMSGSLTDWFNRVARLQPAERRLMLVAAIAGGFGAVFGVPVAGCVFALEVQSVGRLRYDALVPALVASIVGDLVVLGLGVDHLFTPTIPEVDLTAAVLGKVVVAGLVFGLVALAFSELTHGLKRLLAATVTYPPVRPFLGGLAVVGLTYAVGTRDYLGLSLELIEASLAGVAAVATFAFLWKLAFTAVTLGSGFQGGEVTPLFVIGATLGSTLGHLLGLPLPLAAALGFVAVFAGATNTPLACTIMGVELFGSGPFVLLLVACTVSYLFSSHRSIYTSQRVGEHKAGGDIPDVQGGLTIARLAAQRRHWLPPRRPRDPGVETTGTTGTTEPPSDDAPAG